MKYKVGDRVRILPCEEILKNLDRNHYDANGVYYNEEMLTMYSGKVYTIECANYYSYKLRGQRWCWTDIAFAPVKANNRVSKRYVQAYTIWQNMMCDGLPESAYIAKFFNDVKYHTPIKYDAEEASIFEQMMIKHFLGYLLGGDIKPIHTTTETRKWAEYLMLG